MMVTAFVIGNPNSVQNKLNTPSLPQASNSNAEGGNFSTPTLNVSERKRKDTKAVDAPTAAKRSRGRSSSSRKIVVQGMVLITCASGISMC